MESKINLKVAGIMMGIAIFLVSSAFLTITSSFAFTPVSGKKTFDVSIANVQSKTMDLNNFSIRKDSLLFNIHLDNNNRNNSFVFDIKNKGNIDAILANIDKNEINDISIFEYNNKEYYLGDLVFYTVLYAGNNEENKIVDNGPVLPKDGIKANTTNAVIVNVRLKKDVELDQETIEARNYYLSNNSIDKTLHLNMSFKEA